MWKCSGRNYIGVLATAFYKGSEEFKQFQNNLILTNNIAGITYDQFRNISSVISSNFNITVGQAKDILNVLESLPLTRCTRLRMLSLVLPN